MKTQLLPAEAASLHSGVPLPEVMLFHAANVIGTQEIPIEVGPTMSVSAVTESIVHRMALPTDVAYGLRDDDTSAYLDDSSTIGESVKPGSHITVIPKAHLGGAAHCRD